MTANGLHGIGMTSQRTRARMIERLREKGIRNEAVLKAIKALDKAAQKGVTTRNTE